MTDSLLGQGPRALWTAVVVAGAAALVGLAAGAAFAACGEEGVVAHGARALVALSGTALLLWAALRATGIGFSALGLAPAAGARTALVEAGAGLGTVLVGAVLVLGAAVIVGAAELSGPPAQTWGLIPLTLLAVVLPEETVFRGYVQHVLGARWRGFTVVAAQAVLYAVSVAVVQLSLAGLVWAFLLGFLLGYLRLHSVSLWNVLGVRSGFVLASGLAAGTDLSTSWETALSVVPALAALATVHWTRRGTVASAAGRDREPRPRRPLVQKGVLYDVGSSYLPGQHSRQRWRPDVVAEEMRIIAEDLDCTAVTVFGHDLERLEEATRLALARGLFVWVQPRLVDGPQQEIVARMERTAMFCETLRTEHADRVGLNVGCELTIFARGILPGRTFARRTAALSVLYPLMPLFNRRLGSLLQRLVGTARSRFGGPLTYGSGSWESVDWSIFDMVGIDYYLDVSTRGDYRGGLRTLHRWHKPILVTEFGCCAYRGARDMGGSGADILDWSDLNDRKVKPGYIRDEQVQAETIGELLDVYETEDIHGAFVCMFIEGDCRYSTDPDRDQDKASFGIVRPPSIESGLSPDDGHWEPKAAFHALADRYASR